jgi:hypothetical protein
VFATPVAASTYDDAHIGVGVIYEHKVTFSLLISPGISAGITFTDSETRQKQENEWWHLQITQPCQAHRLG